MGTRNRVTVIVASKVGKLRNIIRIEKKVWSIGNKRFKNYSRRMKCFL